MRQFSQAVHHIPSLLQLKKSNILHHRQILLMSLPSSIPTMDDSHSRMNMAIVMNSLSRKRSRDITAPPRRKGDSSTTGGAWRKPKPLDRSLSRGTHSCATAGHYRAIFHFVILSYVLP